MQSWLDPNLKTDPNMAKRSVYVNITPLPPAVSRETAVQTLHEHATMIRLNPLVIRHAPSTAPPNARQDEKDHMTWYEIADQIRFLPGSKAKNEVVYRAGFYDLPRGLQTHVLAPAGVDIHANWSVRGNLPGEPREPVELGLDAPSDGLYLREDVDLRCNVLLSNFVKRNLKKSHAVLVQRLLKKADLAEENKSLGRASSSSAGLHDQSSAVFSPGASSIHSHNTSLTSRSASPYHTVPGIQTHAQQAAAASLHPQQQQPPPAESSSFGQSDMSIHPAFRTQTPHLQPDSFAQLPKQSPFESHHLPTDSSYPTPESNYGYGHGQTYQPQMYLDQPDFDASAVAVGTSFYPEDINQDWSDIGEHHQGSGVGYPQGQFDAMELDSIPITAQQYYAYQAQRNGEGE